MSFIHLHVHSEYSWLDGACSIDDLVQRAVQLKLPAVAITDRNSVAGAFRLWHQCIRAGIKPIIGLEIEVWNDVSDGRAFSVILLASGRPGFENLCLLVSLAHEHDPQSPRISKSQLKEHAEGLICLSFSVVGELCTLLLEGKDEQARQVSDWYYGVFGDNYFYELQNHGLPREALAMNKVLNLAYETRIPVVLTNDCHYMQRGESIAIDALNCIRKGLDFSHPEAKRFACNEYYFKTPKEMKALYDFPPQLITNTLAIADKIDVTGGYISVPESEVRGSTLMEMLRTFSPTLWLRFKPNSKHIRVSLMDNKLAGVLEHLRQQLPDFEILAPTVYEAWTPGSIYQATLQVMKVPDEKIRELCGLIPPEAKTLLEAALISADFSCLSSEDYVCSVATRIGDTLIKTIRNARADRACYAIIPRGLAVPLLRDSEGNARCQFSRLDAEMAGLFIVEFGDSWI